MNFKNFLSLFTDAIKEWLPDTSTVSVITITRNNGTYHHAISIMEESKQDSPLVYMASYYEAYCSGTTIPQLVARFIDEYKQYIPFEVSFPNFPKKPEQLKNYIFVKLIHYENNLDLLKTIPHRKQLDLALVYELVVPHQDDGFGFAMITNGLMHTLGLTEEQLYHIAWQNMLLSNPPIILSMERIIPIPCPPVPMYIVTNHNKIHGAAYLFHQETIDRLANHLESDLYIFPSSIHEIIVTPWTLDSKKEELDQMVHDINIQAVELEEQLSNHTYLYKRDTGCIEL